MANIEPYEYQKRTNIEEHNDLVSKINEIIDVINQTNIETILPKISKLEADVSAINDTDNVQNTDISNLKEKDVQIDNRLTLDESNIDDITKSLVSDVVLMNGTTTGNMKARIGRENAPSIDSNDYNIQKPVSVELVQGSASAMVKAKITLSDGTVLISDDFMFTTEAIGTDVYISSFVFKNGNVAGTISADIGLSNGSSLEANNFAVPTDPNVISTISDLQTRLSAVEGGSIGGLDELKATVDGHTTSINELNTDVADLTTNKADVNNGNQTITAGTVNANNINKSGVAVATVNDIPVVPDISGKVDIAQGVSNAGKVLGVNDSGNVEPIEVSSGQVWEELNLSNLPLGSSLADGTILRIQFKRMAFDPSSYPSNWTATFSGCTPSVSEEVGSTIEVPWFNHKNYNLQTIINYSNPLSKYVSLIVMQGFQLLDTAYMQLMFWSFNGATCLNNSVMITRANASSYIEHIWKLAP